MKTITKQLNLRQILQLFAKTINQNIPGNSRGNLTLIDPKDMKNKQNLLISKEP
jgi:hypothetical protein